MKTALIAGIAAGSGVAGILIVLAMWFYCSRQSPQQVDIHEARKQASRRLSMEYWPGAKTVAGGAKAIGRRLSLRPGANRKPGVVKPTTSVVPGVNSPVSSSSAATTKEKRDKCKQSTSGSKNYRRSAWG
jgi:hypothetical protein